MCHASLNFDSELGHVADLYGVVWFAEDRVGEILAYLILVDFERGGESHVADVVAA